MFVLASEVDGRSSQKPRGIVYPSPLLTHKKAALFHPLKLRNFGRAGSQCCCPTGGAGAYGTNSPGTSSCPHRLPWNRAKLRMRTQSSTRKRGVLTYTTFSTPWFKPVAAKQGFAVVERQQHRRVDQHGRRHWARPRDELGRDGSVRAARPPPLHVTHGAGRGGAGRCRVACRFSGALGTAIY